jgi:hypothetical protein
MVNRRQQAYKTLNGMAKGHILRFLGPVRRSQLLHLSGGIEIWKKLKMDFRHWQYSRGPALQRQYDNFRPRDTETVVAMCDRYDGLCLQRDRVGMAPAPRAAIQHFVNQLKAERPAWY